MDLFATLLAIAVIVKLWPRFRAGESWRTLFPRTGFEWVWPLWLLVISISFWFSPLGLTEWGSRIAEFRWILLLYLVAVAMREVRPNPRVQKVASALLGLCSFYAIVVWFLGFDPIKPDYDLAPWAGGHRTGGLYSNAMTFAHVYGMALALFAGVALWDWAGRWREKWWATAAIVLTSGGILLSFTRGVWGAVAIALVVMTFVIRPRWGFILSGAGAAVLGVALAAWPTLRQRLTMAATGGDERQWIWQGHWAIFRDHPWTGVGYGQNSKLIPEYFEKLNAPRGVLVSHAHNQYLHFLAGTGVIGLAMYLLVLGSFLWLSHKTYYRLQSDQVWEKGLVLGALGVQLVLILGGLTESNFEHSKVKHALVLSWALVLWLSSAASSENESSRARKRS